MSRSARTLASVSLALVLAAACGDDDNDTGQDGSPDGSADGSDGGDGGDGGDGDSGADGADGEDGDPGDGDAGAPDLAASCATFCSAQQECLGFTEADCMTNCMAQVDMYTALDCVAEGAAENECMATLSCEELMAYAREGRRAHATCGEVARDLYASCTVGESAACTAMCERYETCDALSMPVGACEEECLLRIANLTWSADEACANAFVDVASCISEASCEDLQSMSSTGAIPPSCEAEDTAQRAACSP